MCTVLVVLGTWYQSKKVVSPKEAFIAGAARNPAKPGVGLGFIGGLDSWRFF